MIAIIDYDAGNIKSVEKAVKYLGYESCLSRRREDIIKADKLILPGVGSFGDAMEKLNGFGLTETIKEAVSKKTPILGICLGLQLMFGTSEESPGAHGLELLPGKILRFPEKEGYKIPHMGWNTIKIKKKNVLFHEIPDDSFVYFVHSYYLRAAEEDVASETEYTTVFHSAVEHENIFATQFHPEKSGETGLSILNNYCRLA